MTFQKLFILTVLFLSISSFSQVSESPEISKDSAFIARIIIDGNGRTKERWFLTKTGFVEGELYDSLKLIKAEQILKDSKLFSFSKIYPIINGNRATILITVREKRYFKITDYSGAMYSKKWGQKSKTFLQAYGAFKLNNFRGMEEELKLSLSFWTIRYLNLSWYKPFLKNPYFITIGSTVGSRPSINSPWNLDFYNLTYGSFGRRFSTHSKLSLQLDGRYTDYSWKGAYGTLYKNGSIAPTINIGTEHEFVEDSHIEFDLEEYSTNAEDTLGAVKVVSVETVVDSTGDTNIVYTFINKYEWQGGNSEARKFYEKPYTESYLSLKWVTDKRDNNYNAHKGFLTAFRLSSNFLYPFIDIVDSSSNSRREASFLRFASDLRFYHRGIWESNTVAYRAQPTLTLLGKGNRYSGIYMGDIGNLRGYGSGYFGSYQYNNRFLFSLEYRFPLFKMPELKFPFLSWYDKGMANLSTKFDGAILFDYGRIWANLKNPINDVIEPIAAIGIGLGIRVISPNVRRSLCFDVVWGIPPANSDKPGKPAWYLYIDMPY